MLSHGAAWTTAATLIGLLIMPTSPATAAPSLKYAALVADTEPNRTAAQPDEDDANRGLRQAFEQIEELRAQLTQLSTQHRRANGSTRAVLPLALEPGRARQQHGVFVVTDYGADPSGVNDSTAGIQAAIWDATYASFLDQVGDKHAQSGDGIGGILEPEVRFPGGRYRVTATVDLVAPGPVHMPEMAAHCATFLGNQGRNSSWCHHGYLRLKGDGQAKLVMENDSADVFVGQQLTALTVSFLSFLNGRRQLYVGNNNTDQSTLKITDCVFQASTGAAIHIAGPDCNGCPVGVGNCPGNGPADPKGRVDSSCIREPFPRIGS